jgi:hypothetical protein
MPVPGDWTRLRQIMYEPSSCWLATEHSGDRWLTDQFVLYNVTGMEELTEYDYHLADCTWEETVECSCPDELPDGAYKVTVSKGFQPRDSVPEPDIEAYFGIMASHIWYSATPSEWSVAEHPGKAMLWGAAGGACLLGESTWTQISRHYPGCEVAYAFNRSAGVFRFTENGVPFAYAAGIQIPEGQEGVAHAIASATQLN